MSAAPHSGPPIMSLQTQTGFQCPEWVSSPGLGANAQYGFRLVGYSSGVSVKLPSIASPFLARDKARRRISRCSSDRDSALMVTAAS